MFHPTVVKFFSFRMPAKRTQARKRTRRTAEEGPLAQRSRRETTRDATLASRGSTSVPAEDESNVIPLTNTPPAVQRLDPSLVQSLVSTVTAEVTRQLTATLPALASLEGPSTSTATGDGSELAEERRPSVPPLPGVSATNLVEGAIAAAHSRITGAPQLLPTSVQTQRQVNPSQIFLSASLPIDSQLSAKIKEKIWNEEFVDFGSLLSNSVHDKYQISVQNTDTGAPASFCLEPVSRPKKIMSIEVWQQAFNIFVGVYTQKHPHEAPALMKYGQTIRDLAASGQNWRFYDENFRFLRRAQANLVPWGSIHAELWLRSQFPVKTQSTHYQPTGVPKSGGPPVPSGFCFKFHRGQFCSAINCAFKHTCFKCKKGAHSASKCNFRAPTGKSNANSDRPTKSSNTSQAQTSS